MSHLKSILASLLSDTPSRTCVREFVNLCHKMALAYLRNKTKNGRLNSALNVTSLEDLALDCIADLFQRDARGVFIKLVAYFEAADWESKNEDELTGATRRLIFGKVNHAFCRIYREADPSLGRLLRNLKSAIKSSPLFALAQRDGEAWICLNPEDGANASLPVMPPEFLEAHLTASLRSEADVKQVLTRLVEILRDQQTYRRSYPLTSLALIIRSAFVHLHAALEHESNGHENFAPEEIEKLIAASVKIVKSNMHSSYVAKQKLDCATYDACFLAIRDLFAAEYVQNDGFNRSYYDYLRLHLQELTREHYQRRCRCHFEYLAKLTRQELLQNLKKEL